MAQPNIESLTQTPCRKVYDGQASQLCRLCQQVDRHLQLFGVRVELGLVHGLSQPDLTVDDPGVVDSVDHVPCASLRNILIYCLRTFQ